MSDDNSTSLVNLGNLSKPADTLIKKVSSVVGGIFEPGAVQTQDDLLMLFLDRHKKHVRACDGLTDRGGIRRVVLAALAGHAVGCDELGRHQPDRVAVLPELSRPVMCARAGFHADGARRQLCDQRQQIRARNFRLDQGWLAVIIYTVHGKHVLGEIDSYGEDAHGLPLSWC